MGQESGHGLTGSSISQGCNQVLAGAVGSFRALPGEGFTSKLTEVLAGFRSMWAVGLRASGSCYLVATDRSEFLAMPASLIIVIAE